MDALHAALARLPQRQLHLLMAGVLLVTAALLWSFALRAPLAALRAQRADQLLLEQAVSNPRQMAAQLAALTAQVAAQERAATQLADSSDAEAAAGAANSANAADASRMQLALIGQVDRACARHGVRLRLAVPAAARPVATFTEVAIDVEVAGSYRALLALLRDIDADGGKLAVVSFDLVSGDGASGRLMKIRLAAYLPPGTSP